MTRRGVCFVLAAPSGAGKSSILAALRAQEPDLTLSISVTTRPPRPYERDGEHYVFRTQADFDAMREGGELLEWAGILGRSYGSPRAPVEAALAEGRDVAFDIDWQGYRQLRAALPGDTVGVFVLPPSLAELEARLRARASDSAEGIARRMATAQAEMSHAAEFDFILVNRDFDRAVADTRAVLHAVRLATHRQADLAGTLAALAQGGAEGGAGG